MISLSVAGTAGLVFCSSGIRIVENPRLEPNVRSSRFFAPTAKNCGKASFIFDIGCGIHFPEYFSFSALHCTLESKNIQIERTIDRKFAINF